MGTVTPDAPMVADRVTAAANCTSTRGSTILRIAVIRAIAAATSMDSPAGSAVRCLAVSRVSGDTDVSTTAEVAKIVPLGPLTHAEVVVARMGVPNVVEEPSSITATSMEVP